MAVILSFFFGFIPILFYAWLVYWLDRYEKEPTVLLGLVFVWGILIAGGFAFLANTLLGWGVYMFTGSESTTNVATGSLIAPLVEESLKGLAVFGIFLIFRDEFDSLLDGMIYAAVTALGFAALENTYYIYNGYVENGYQGLLILAFVRVILVGWQHPFYTAFIGLGLAAARLSSRAVIRFLAPVAGWLAAVLAHSLHNTLSNLLIGPGGLMIGTVIDWTGWLAMLTFIILLISREKNNLVTYLREEAISGTITVDQYNTACSSWSQTRARLAALAKGRYRSTVRFYQICGELAHKKHQLARLGDESGNYALIYQLRNELRNLSSHI